MLSPAEKMASHRKAKRKRGECGWSGCHVKSGDDYYCDPHKADHAARMALSRQKAKAA